jgi:hypothetical protein
MISTAVGCTTLPFRNATWNEVWLADNGKHPRGLGIFAELPDRPLSGASAYPGQTLDIAFTFLNLFTYPIFLDTDIVEVYAITWMDPRGGGPRTDFKKPPDPTRETYVRLPGTSETRNRMVRTGEFKGAIMMRDGSFFRTRRIVDIPADVGGATSVTVNANFGIKYYPDGSRRWVYCPMEGQYTLAIITNRPSITVSPR